MRYSKHFAILAVAGTMTAFAAAPAGAQALESGPPPVGPELTAQQIQRLQRNLNAAGYEVAVDGVWSSGTEEAVRKFQEDRGLSPSSQLDDDSMAILDGEHPVVPEGAATPRGGDGN